MLLSCSWAHNCLELLKTICALLIWCFPDQPLLQTDGHAAVKLQQVCGLKHSRGNKNTCASSLMDHEYANVRRLPVKETKTLIIIIKSKGANWSSQNPAEWKWAHLKQISTERYFSFLSQMAHKGFNTTLSTVCGGLFASTVAETYQKYHTHEKETIQYLVFF